MKSIKNLVNFGVFIILFSELNLRAPVVNCEESFPQRFPLDVESQVAFTQYLDVPMLSLEEIKNGFPWLKISTETILDHKEGEERPSTVERKPRYVFHYVPTEVVVPQSVGNSEFRNDYKIPKLNIDSESERQDKNSFKFEMKMIEQSSPKEVTRKVRRISKHVKPNERDRNIEPSIESEDLSEEKQKYARHRSLKSGDEEEYRGLKSKKVIRDHKLREKNLPAEIRFSRNTETKFVPNYSYARIPSPYMEPPRIEFEDKEYWLKNKRKSKRPTMEDSSRNKERLKNHRLVKQKKIKLTDLDNEERLKNHRPVYDREHDPTEQAESSNDNVEELRKRRKEKSENSSPQPPQDRERIDFQIHGHEGPQSYIFGYDTGSGENRHFRLEERLNDGSVRGHYGYYDANGKLKMVEYKASPMDGYEEKHHQSSSGKADLEDTEKNQR